jgi:hypothetical protein
VARRFIIKPRDYFKYTKEQLDEKVKYQLRLFEFEGVIWYAAKDVGVYLGITCNNLLRNLVSIKQANVLKKNVNIRVSHSETQENPLKTREVEIWLLREACAGQLKCVIIL